MKVKIKTPPECKYLVWIGVQFLHRSQKLNMMNLDQKLFIENVFKNISKIILMLDLFPFNFFNITFKKRKFFEKEINK
jgi:hypothetical protein